MVNLQFVASSVVFWGLIVYSVLLLSHWRKDYQRPVAVALHKTRAVILVKTNLSVSAIQIQILRQKCPLFKSRDKATANSKQYLYIPYNIHEAAAPI